MKQNEGIIIQDELELPVQKVLIVNFYEGGQQWASYGICTGRKTNFMQFV